MMLRIPLRFHAALALLLLLGHACACEDNIDPGPGPGGDELTALAIEPDGLVLVVGQTETLLARGTAGSGARDVTAEAEWSSSDDAIATVDANGAVTARAVGSAQITAALGILSASVSVQIGSADGGVILDGGAPPLGPPETTIDAAPPVNSSDADVSFAFSCDQAGCTFECDLDGSGFSACTSPENSSELADGLHVFRVRAISADGQSDASPAEHSWVIDTRTPDTVIGDAPTSPTTETSATFTFVCDENDCNFECDLDDGGYAACTSPHDVTLSDGDHVFSVRAADPAGNADGSPAAHAWTVDTTPPETTLDTTPGNPSAASSAAFEFSCSETDCAFECDLDGAGFTACLPPQVYLGLADAMHSFQVRAIDAAGNTDASPAQHDWTIDESLSGLSFTTVPDQPTNVTNATFEFTCDVGGCIFECAIDGGSFSACASGVAYSGLADGLHTFEVRAGPMATPASYSWVIDTRPPQTTLAGAPPDPTNQTTATFELGCDELGCVFECEIDGAGFNVCDGTETWGPFADGSHTFRARSTDVVGNVDATPAEHSWTINTDAPEVSFDGTPADRTNNTSASFDFTCNEDDCSYECQLDGGALEACNSPKVYFNLEDGPHTFRVYAFDPAGNKSTLPAEHSWTIDTASPVVTITAAPPNPSNEVDASFVFSCGEASCTFQCELDGTGMLPCNSPHDYLGLLTGFHVFRVQATDDAGNTGEATSYSWNIDLAGPQATITIAPSDPDSSTSASFEFTCNEATCDYECQIDGATFEDCTSPKIYTLSYDAHTFGVRAVDGAGNVGPTATHSWTIECSLDAECGQDSLCESGGCVPGNCRTNPDCETGEICANSFCSGCADDTECPGGFVCLADGLCAVDVFGSGADGAAVAPASTSVDLSISSLVGRGAPDAPVFRVTAFGTNAVLVATTPTGLAVGDEVALITVRGTQNLNTATYFKDNVGNWETLTVANVAGTQVDFTTDIVETYGSVSNATAGTANEPQRFIVLARVPNYSSLTVETGAMVTTRTFQPSVGQRQENQEVFNAAFGGLVFARVSGALTVQTGASISVQGLGYRGGERNGDNGEDGQAGEGPAGFGLYGCGCSGNYNADPSRQPSPVLSNAGGGGSYVTGAGGGYGTAGEDATTWRDAVTLAAQGGETYGTPTLDQLFFGGGGGGIFNSGNNSCPSGVGEGPAANGGGILALYARTATIDGTLTADGDDAFYADDAYNSFGTGGGAGGSLLLVVDDATVSGAITSTGGLGRDPVEAGCGGTDPMTNRKGGDGGDGRIRFDFAQINGNVHGSSGADAVVAGQVTPAPGHSVHP
jgi:hypothetical protein